MDDAGWCDGILHKLVTQQILDLQLLYIIIEFPRNLLHTQYRWLLLLCCGNLTSNISTRSWSKVISGIHPQCRIALHPCIISHSDLKYSGKWRKGCSYNHLGKIVAFISISSPVSTISGSGNNLFSSSFHSSFHLSFPSLPFFYYFFYYFLYYFFSSFLFLGTSLITFSSFYFVFFVGDYISNALTDLLTLFDWPLFFNIGLPIILILAIYFFASIVSLLSTFIK